MSDTYGPMWPTPLARYDRASSSWRTCEDTSLWDLPMSLETLPGWGMTLDGVLYLLPTPERPTVAPECSSLPTPQAADGTKMSSNPETSARRRMKGNQEKLTDIVQTDLLPPDYLLPTPTVMDMGANYTPEEWEAWKAAQKANHQNGNGHGASLTQEAISLLPTPRAQNGEERNQNIWERPTDQPQNLENALALLPTPTVGNVTGGNRTRGGDRSDELLLPGVALSIGASTPPPSPDGSPSSDDDPQLPLFPA